MTDNFQLVSLLPRFWASSFNDWSMPFFNLPMTAVATAAMGSLLSFAWGEREQDKRKLYLTAVASAFTGIVAVAVLPGMMGWEWVNESVQAPFAGLTATAVRFVIPPAITLVPDILRKLFRLDTDRDDSSGGDRSRGRRN